MSDDAEDIRKVPTKRDTGTLQRGPGFAAESLALAHRMARLVAHFTSVKHTNIHAAIACKRMLDEASILTLAFESWATNATSSEDRVSTVDQFIALKERAERFGDVETSQP